MEQIKRSTHCAFCGKYLKKEERYGRFYHVVCKKCDEKYPKEGRPL